MHGLSILLAIKLLTLEDALAEAAKDPKPVVLCSNVGEKEGLADSVEKIFGERVKDFHFASKSFESAEEVAASTYGLGIAWLDPGLEDGPDRVLVRLQIGCGTGSVGQEDPLKGFCEDALRQFAIHQSCRSVIRDALKAVADGDAKKLREIGWFKEGPELSDADLEARVKAFQAELKDTGPVRFEAIVDRSPRDEMKEITKDFEAHFRAKLVFRGKDEKDDHTYMSVVKAGGKFFAVIDE